MSPDELVSCPGVLALELTAGETPGRTSLERDEAERLAAFMAEDLRGLLPEVEKARLAVAGAHFDSTELLRPGFPVFATLTGLAERLDGGVVAFGARDGHMPAAPLVPDESFTGGALRLIPWTLLAGVGLADKLGSDMEVELVGRGEAGTRTADYLMRTLGIRLEHLRYFSRHDLMALVCVHYEHVNLAALWELLEAALLSPGRSETMLSAHGLAWRQADGQAFAQTPGTWLAATTLPMDERAHALAGIVFELRQYAALLAAHHVELGFDAALLAAHHVELGFDAAHFDAAGQFVVDALAEPDADLAPARLYAHEAPGLGVIALSVAQSGADHPHLLATAWPLSRELEAACRYLADTCGCPVQPDGLGQVVLDANGRLSVPTTNVH